MPPSFAGRSLPLIRWFCSVFGDIFNNFLTSLLFSHSFFTGCAGCRIFFKSSSSRSLNISRSSLVTTSIAITSIFSFSQSRQSLSLSSGLLFCILPPTFLCITRGFFLILLFCLLFRFIFSQFFALCLFLGFFLALVKALMFPLLFFLNLDIDTPQLTI